MFGAGTRLTVVEPKRTFSLPTVKVIVPSKTECQNGKSKKKTKTLVCVAFGFYPDHVSVSWQIDGENVNYGIATDSTALLRGEYYSISSRLRVPLREWLTTNKNFSCRVSFFDGTKTEHIYSWIEGPGPGAIREKYLRITNIATLSYTVLIVKSGLYGAFVAFLLWRLQGSSGKQDK